MIPTFDKEVLDTIEKIIGIPFISDSYATGAVCFANNEEVRPEFRLSFNTFHVLDYSHAIIFKSEETANLLKIPFPEDSTCFWELVAIGAKLRKSGLIDKISNENLFKIKWYNKNK
jgi:hypothetical protein